jgi:hypothetical protein
MAVFGKVVRTQYFIMEEAHKLLHLAAIRRFGGQVPAETLDKAT